LLLSVPLAANAQLSTEVELTKTFSGLLPVEGEYVSYDITLTNTGNASIENRSMWTLFVSEGGKTHSAASFAISSLEPDEKKMLHLGPFKMSEGQHSLFLGINRQGNSSISNDLSISYGPDKPADSFYVFDPLQLDLMIAGVAATAIGAGLLASIYIYKKRH
jgi:hypothetical protein